MRRADLSFPARLFVTLAALVFAALAALTTAPPVLAQNPDRSSAQETRERLQKLEEDIALITQRQRDREAQRSSLQAELRKRELTLGRLSQEQQSTKIAISANQTEIAGLRERQGELRGAAQSQQSAVAIEIREAWKGAGKTQLKLLLGEDDPQLLARMLAYYRYILAARSTLLDQYRETLTSLSALEETLQTRDEELARQQQTLLARQRELESTRTQRQALLAQIEIELRSEALQLTAREKDRAQLEVLLAEIDVALAQLIPSEDVEPFSAVKGDMRWPVDGRITDRFGRPRNQGKMRWQGVRLKSDAGTPVSAIHHGRVVYADWLRGSGLLLVIDHGEGYMSLYAHNESLLRDVGDWVNAGAAIATVGDSGGQSEAGLYFEIRKDGKPTDPQRWCRS